MKGIIANALLIVSVSCQSSSALKGHTDPRIGPASQEVEPPDISIRTLDPTEFRISLTRSNLNGDRVFSAFAPQAWSMIQSRGRTYFAVFDKSTSTPVITEWRDEDLVTPDAGKVGLDRQMTRSWLIRTEQPSNDGFELELRSFVQRDDGERDAKYFRLVGTVKIGSREGRVVSVRYVDIETEKAMDPDRERLLRERETIDMNVARLSDAVGQPAVSSNPELALAQLRSRRRVVEEALSDGAVLPATISGSIELPLGS